MRLIQIEELDAALERFESRKAKTARGRTKISEAVSEHKSEVLLSCAALKLLIEEKLDKLRHEKPNWEGDLVRWQASISDYESLLRRVDSLEKAVGRLVEGDPKEITKTAKSFGDGVSDWWSKRSESICSSGFNAALFLSAVTMCSLMGVGAPLAGVVGAVVVGHSASGKLSSLAKKAREIGSTASATTL
jgi:hypothetical protein